jgi:uncharacterized protein YutE (UPF0331/DUF86 family)
VTAPERSAIERRLLALKEAIEQLERPEARDPTRVLGDPVLRAAVERWLQVSIEACLDLAVNAIAVRGWTPPDYGRAAFSTLAAHGLLDPGLATRLGRAVGLRNLLVHDYAAVDPALLARIVGEDAGDLKAFAQTASLWLRS